MVVCQLFDCEPDLRLSDQGEHDPRTQGVWLKVCPHRKVQQRAAKGLLHFQEVERYFELFFLDFLWILIFQF